MVTDLMHVLKQVASIRYVAFNVTPFFNDETTLVTVGCVKDDGTYGDATFSLESELLLSVSNEDLKQYFITQIDRLTAGLPVQEY